MRRRSVVLRFAVGIRIFHQLGETGICDARSRSCFRKHSVKSLQTILPARLDIWDGFKRALDEFLMHVLVHLSLHENLATFANN